MRSRQVELTDENTPRTYNLQTMERELPYPDRMKKSHYEAELLQLQIELVKLQSWVQSSGQRILMIFEGRDAAGKGGAIKRFTELTVLAGSCTWDSRASKPI